MKTTNTSRKKTGPKPISFIPPIFQGLSGIEQVSTHLQLVKLKAYMETPSSKRPGYVCLGASVPPSGIKRGDRRPNATYAVSIYGEIQIIRRFQDPRAAFRWMQNSRRPWNLAKEFAASEELS